MRLYLPRQSRAWLNIFWLAALGFMFWVFYDRINFPDMQLGEFEPGLFCFGILSGILSSYFAVVILKRYFPENFRQSEWGKAFVLTYLPAAGKYLPGVGWSILGFVIQAEYIAGIRKRDSLLFQLYYQLINFVSSLSLLIIGILSMVQFISDEISHAVYASGLIVLVGGVIGIVVLTGQFKKYRVGTERNILTDIFLISIQKIFKGIALLVFMSAWFDPWGKFLEILFAFVAAMQAGVLAFFAPAGLGVTEGIYALLLSDVLSMAIALKIAVIARLLQSLIDLILVVSAYLWRWSIKPHVC